MKTIGITGGIGSGKSVVSALLELYGIPVYIADEESKRLTQSSPVIRKGLIELFDESIYTGEGLDKRRLASLIFGNPQMLKAVNSLIHPEVYKDYLQWAESKHTELCALESAILFESGFDKLADYTVMVYAPEEIRIQRAMNRDSSSRTDVTNRIKNQLPDEIKRDKSDFVILNDGIQALIPQVESLLKQIRPTL